MTLPIIMTEANFLIGKTITAVDEGLDRVHIRLGDCLMILVAEGDDGDNGQIGIGWAMPGHEVLGCLGFMTPDELLAARAAAEARRKSDSEFAQRRLDIETLTRLGIPIPAQLQEPK